ncbi:MAG: alpha/beta hydrolase [Desulfobulbaceae bacterium]|jgi:pimeloyl-ACP methyl ester carboxylesterase|nr:alpha/beta hydrolase [Desulfobulbaceae bacterium]
MSKRVDVEFVSGKDVCRAWLYRPPVGIRGPRPCIVMAHGLGGTRDAGLEPYAEKFSRAGYLVLLFDYRHFGASGGEPRQLFSIRRQLQDWEKAIWFARGLGDVDPRRIALWGTSFSGGHVIVAAVKSGRIAAVSAQCPMMDALAAAMNAGRYAGPTSFLKLGAMGMIDRVRALLGMPPLYIPLIAPPGELAAMSSHDSASGYRALVPPGWQNRICPRYVLSIAAYRPINYAKRLSCPALIQVCLKDSLAPPHSALETARKIGARAELKQYDCGHFDIYLGELFEQASDEQLEFFNRVLSPGP